MNEQLRVEIDDGSAFNAREWLRREVLWGSLMQPYTMQLDTWVNGKAIDVHNGNVSRRDLFPKALGEDNPEAQAESFFNQGKNIAAMVNAVSLFKACSQPAKEETFVDFLKIQADSVDWIFNLTSERLNKKIDDIEVHNECTSIVQRGLIKYINEIGEIDYDAMHNLDSFRIRRFFISATKLMVPLAGVELRAWIEDSKQAEDDSLPFLTIRNGGTARSVGDRVDMLKPVFQSFVESDRFMQLGEKVVV